MCCTPVTTLSPRAGQGSHHQGGPAPEISRLYRRAVEGGHTVHHRHPALHPDVRPHAGELIHVAVAAFKNVLHKYGGAPCSPSWRPSEGPGRRWGSRGRGAVRTGRTPRRGPVRRRRMARRPLSHRTGPPRPAPPSTVDRCRQSAPVTCTSPPAAAAARQICSRHNPVAHHGELPRRGGACLPGW